MADASARQHDPDIRQVAAFDFDGTLVPGDSLLPFVWRAAGPRRFLHAVARHGLRTALATGARIGSRDAAKAAFVSTAMRGLPSGDVVGAGVEFSHRLEPKVHPAALDRIAWHRDRGHELVLISASLLAYLEPLAERLGFDAVLATGLEVGQDGFLTGALDGLNVRGPEKVARLEAWLDGRPCELWAYGDSHGDRELLARADHGQRIRRGRFGPAVDA
jgi:phosphatidylglycerophosphatase C